MRKLASIEHNQDGSVTFSINVMTRKIRASDGTFRTLYSYDNGESWGAKAGQMRSKIERAERLHEYRPKMKDGAKEPSPMDKIAERHSGVTVRVPEPVLMEMPSHHGQPLSREGAKKTRRSLRNFKNVVAVRPVHIHRCHNATYSCSCDTPWKKRPCGGSHCLYDHAHPNIVSELTQLFEARRLK